jgi:hypothetical protein
MKLLQRAESPLYIRILNRAKAQPEDGVKVCPKCRVCTMVQKFCTVIQMFGLLCKVCTVVQMFELWYKVCTVYQSFGLWQKCSEHVPVRAIEFRTPRDFSFRFPLFRSVSATALRTHLLISINPTVGRNRPFPFSYSSLSSQSRQQL